MGFLFNSLVFWVFIKRLFKFYFYYLLSKNDNSRYIGKIRENVSEVFYIVVVFGIELVYSK